MSGSIAVRSWDAVIAGEKVGAGAAFDDVDPSTGEVLARVARCGAPEIDRAVAAARAAHEEAWRRTSPAHRGRVLRRLAELLRRDAERIAEMESLDTGKPLRQARADAEVAARYFEFYGGAVEAVFGTTIPHEADTFVYTLREPFGVTGHIVPWNYPVQITSRTVAPALAAGNCCVVKPAEEAPLTSLLLAELALEAGLPAGALNVVPGFGEEAGAALAAHPGIDHLAFTGSVEVGRLVSKAAAENVVPVTLELGGKSPNIVLADADLDAAAPVIVNSILQNAGQTCSAGSRLLVERSVRDDLVEQVVARMREVTIGPGIEDPGLGPLITARQLDRVLGFVETGRREGRLLTGGGRPQGLDRGFFVSPTVFDDVPPEASLAMEEVFGPVLAVTPFEGLAEAARYANGTPYGLIAAIWTRDVGRAHWLAREMRAGQVYVNMYGAGGGVELPFGGYKKSGHGREKGYEALVGYTQTKTVAVRVSGP